MSKTGKKKNTLPYFVLKHFSVTLKWTNHIEKFIQFTVKKHFLRTRVVKKQLISYLFVFRFKNIHRTNKHKIIFAKQGQLPKQKVALLCDSK